VLFAKAVELESNGELVKALNEWEVLRAIVDSEIRDQNESKSQ